MRHNFFSAGTRTSAEIQTILLVLLQHRQSSKRLADNADLRLTQFSVFYGIAPAREKIRFFDSLKGSVEFISADGTAETPNWITILIVATSV